MYVNERIRCNNYSNPKDPAVIPTHIKNPNSRRSLEPEGIEFNRRASGITEIQMKIR